jgi:hypothetical protein
MSPPTIRHWISIDRSFGAANNRTETVRVVARINVKGPISISLTSFLTDPVFAYLIAFPASQMQRASMVTNNNSVPTDPVHPSNQLALPSTRRLGCRSYDQLEHTDEIDVNWVFYDRVYQVSA